MSYKWNCVPMHCDPRKKGSSRKFFAITGYKFTSKIYAQFGESLLPPYLIRQSTLGFLCNPKTQHIFAISFSLQPSIQAAKFHGVFSRRRCSCCDPLQRECYRNITDFNFPPKTCQVCFTFYQDRHRKAIHPCNRQYLPYKDRIFLLRYPNPRKLGEFFSMRLLPIRFC